MLLVHFSKDVFTYWIPDFSYCVLVSKNEYAVSPYQVPEDIYCLPKSPYRVPDFINCIPESIDRFQAFIDLIPSFMDLISLSP